MAADKRKENQMALIQKEYEIEDMSTTTESNKIHLRQWVITFNCCLMIMLIGMSQGYSTIIIQELKQSSSTASGSQDLKIENGEIFDRPRIKVESVEIQSWIASSMLLFMIPGSWILAIFSKFVGRKPFLILSVASFTLSWLMIAFSSSTFQILLGRSLCGVSMGVIHGLTYAYQGECIVPRLRQTLTAILSIFFSAGMELCHLVGTWYHWRTTAAFTAIIGVITLGSLSFLPESPVWLLSKKRIPEAVRAWRFLRGSCSLDLIDGQKSQEKSEGTNLSSRGKKFLKATFLKPLGIVLLIFTVAQMTGMSYVTFYCVQMMSDIAGADNAYASTLVFDTFRLASAFGLTFFTKKFSTRSVLLYASFGCSVSLILLAASVFFQIWTPWSSLVLIFLYEATVAIAMGPLPWMFLGELFSTSTKGVGIGIVTSYNCFLSFAIVKMSPFITLTLETWGTFLLYGMFTAVGSVLLCVTVPDTRSKSLKEIELLFSKKTNPT